VYTYYINHSKEKIRCRCSNEEVQKKTCVLDSNEAREVMFSKEVQPKNKNLRT